MIQLKPGREKSLKRRHPWIFSGAVEKASGKAGDTVEVRDASGKPLALAAYSPNSQIRSGRISSPFLILNRQSSDSRRHSPAQGSARCRRKARRRAI